MKIEISIGELVDKVSILSIKMEKMIGSKQLKNIRKEYALLSNVMLEAGIQEVSWEFLKLKEINQRLWDIEDAIRRKESRKEFDDEFIQLARSVYTQNDERASIKREVNIRYKSELMEEKMYIDYKHSEDHENPTGTA